MTNADEICAAVKEARDAGHTVYLTDGTVTREVIRVEISNWGFTRDTLDVLIIDGDENKVWIQIQIKWPWNELDGWALEEMDDGLYIAPEWWHKL